MLAFGLPHPCQRRAVHPWPRAVLGSNPVAASDPQSDDERHLMMNAVEAMSGIGQVQRELLVASAKDRPNSVLLGVRDSGASLDSAALDRVLDAFYTTKPDGMGM